MTDPFVCLTCGAHLPGDAEPPALCPICDEPRQYVRATGQAWRRHDELLDDHPPRIEEEAAGESGHDPGSRDHDLWGIGLERAIAVSRAKGGT